MATEASLPVQHDNLTVALLIYGYYLPTDDHELRTLASSNIRLNTWVHDYEKVVESTPGGWAQIITDQADELGFGVWDSPIPSSLYEDESENPVSTGVIIGTDLTLTYGSRSLAVNMEPSSKPIAWHHGIHESMVGWLSRMLRSDAVRILDMYADDMGMQPRLILNSQLDTGL
jgi:hypothetical protein